MQGESLEIQAFGTQAHKQIPLAHICEILQARTDEILDMIGLDLKRAGYLDRLAAGLVLTGGSSQLRGLAEAAEARLNIPARIGRPHGHAGLTELISTPAYATAVGLVQYALGDRERSLETASMHFERPAAGIFRRLASVGRALMP